jgi:hypothetical protein
MFGDDSLALAHTASYSAASAHSKLWRMASVKRMTAPQLPLASQWTEGAHLLNMQLLLKSVFENAVPDTEE